MEKKSKKAKSHYPALLDIDKTEEAKHKAVLEIKESNGAATLENVSPKEFIISQLYLLDLKLTISPQISDKEVKKRKKEIDQALDFIRDNVETIHYNKAGKELKDIQYVFGLYPEAKRNNPNIREELEKIFLTPGTPARYIVSYSLFGEEIVKKIVNKGKFKRSGHLTDQTLKYNYPKEKSSQLSIFDTLNDSTKKDIEALGREESEIIEGIQLLPSETKLIDCLCKLLHHSSHSIDAKDIDSYGGIELVQHGDKKSPKLAFTLYELTKEYKGGETVGGKDVENVRQILVGLNDKNFLITYRETITLKNGGKTEKKIEAFEKLIRILKLTQTEYSKEEVDLSKKEESVILLNPIFRSQINSKFILYPNDINQRTILAYGSHNISEAAIKLRDYLMRELSSKHYEPEIAVDKLYYQLAEKYMKESRRKKVKESVDRAIQTVKALGILVSYREETNAKGEPKIVFKLNKDWE